MNRKLFIILFSFALNCYAQRTPAQLTSKLDSIYKTSNFPGFAVAIVNENGVVYENAFGFADIENKQKFTLNSVQNIGSVSKTFIGVALVKAIELGYFTLETDINSILPYQIYNPNIKTESIKIKNLATHTSGILDDEDVYSKSFLENKYSDKNVTLFKTFITQNTIPNRTDYELSIFLKNYLTPKGTWYNKSNFNKKAVGSEYNYSNIASALAAHLIELKSGMSFDNFCKNYIFNPLKLEHTSFEFNDSLALNHVKLYNIKKETYPLYSIITYPDGGLKTTCNDLAIYLQEMIKGYAGKSELLKKESFELLFKKQFDDNKLPINFDKKEPNGGIFWRIKKNGMIGHTGSDLGITTFLFFDPKTKIGKIFMTNIEFDSTDGSADEKLIKDFMSVWKTLDGI